MLSSTQREGEIHMSGPCCPHVTSQRGDTVTVFILRLLLLLLLLHLLHSISQTKQKKKRMVDLFLSLIRFNQSTVSRLLRPIQTF